MGEINTQPHSVPFLSSPASVSHWSNPIRRQKAREPFDTVHTGDRAEPGRLEEEKAGDHGLHPSTIIDNFWIVPLEGTEVPSSSRFPISTHRKEYRRDGRSYSSLLKSGSSMLREPSHKVARV